MNVALLFIIKGNGNFLNEMFSSGVVDAIFFPGQHNIVYQNAF